MNRSSVVLSSRFVLLSRHVGAVLLACLAGFLTACGGSADAPPPFEGGPLAVAPTITQQPADLSLTVGQAASFTVAATGTAPLSYQWQRNGTNIAGATSTTYSIQVVGVADSGAGFRAVVSNVAGSATSQTATLSITTSAPVLTITQQPASTSVVAATAASFSVAATCSSGTLNTQWQRGTSVGGSTTFSDIAGATSGTFSVPSPAQTDSGAQFRARLDCSGQSAAASSVATLTVTAPGTVTLSLLPLTGLRDQADVSFSTGIDQESSGSYVFVQESRIKRLSADLLTITTVAGQPVTGGSADGPAATAQFNQPFALTHDPAGNIYVADTGNNTIRRIATDGTVSTLAGLAGSSGTVDATGSAARFDGPSAIAMGPDGDLYVGERNSSLVRRVTTGGVVTTYAGSGNGYLDGAPLSAKFNTVSGLAIAANGDVLVSDNRNNRVRRIVRLGNAAGSVETLAGSGAATLSSADGTGTAAVIAAPTAMIVRGNTVVVRDGAGLVRQIDLSSAVVTTVAGSRALGEGYADGTLSTARIRGFGLGLTGAPNGGFVIADDLAIRTVSASGDIKTIASRAAAGVTDQGIGTLPQMPFALAVNDPQSIAVDFAGNVIISDSGTGTVRRIDAAGTVSLVAGLTGGFHGPVDGVGSEAQFASLGFAVASDSAGVLYAADNWALRRIAPNGATTQLAGSFTTFGAVNGNGSAAQFNRIFGLAAAPGGVVYAADFGNAAVRRIDAAGNVTTYAGVLGQVGSVDGPIATARLNGPRSLALAPDGSLYVVDGFLRLVSADGSTVSTVPNTGGGILAVAVDSGGTVYFSTADGLYVMQGGVRTLLIPVTGTNVLGSNPTLGGVSQLAVLGPKRLVMLSNSQILVATLP